VKKHISNTFFTGGSIAMDNSCETLDLIFTPPLHPLLLCSEMRYENQVHLPDFCLAQDG